MAKHYGASAVTDTCADDDEDAMVTLLSVHSTEESISVEQSRGASNSIKKLASFDIEEGSHAFKPQKSVLKKTAPSPVNTYTSSPPASPTGSPPPSTGARKPGSTGGRECCSIM